MSLCSVSQVGMGLYNFSITLNIRMIHAKNCQSYAKNIVCPLFPNLVYNSDVVTDRYAAISYQV